MNITPPTSLRQDLAYAGRYYLRGWRGLLALVIVIAIPALWLGAPWLVAGAVSLLISLAPCLAMCALGFCMMRNCNKKIATSDGTAKAVPTSDYIPAVSAAAVDASGGATTTPRA